MTKDFLSAEKISLLAEIASNYIYETAEEGKYAISTQGINTILQYYEIQKELSIRPIKNLSYNYLLVRCINPKNSGLTINKIYEAKKSEHLEGCYLVDVGYIVIVDNSVVKVLN